MIILNSKNLIGINKRLYKNKYNLLRGEFETRKLDDLICKEILYKVRPEIPYEILDTEHIEGYLV